MAVTACEELTTVYADLHIHIGQSMDGLPVKITASKKMTFTEILAEAEHHKGLQMIGVIDAHSPPVQREILQGLDSGRFEEHSDGGIQYRGVTCLLGTEIEIKEPGMKPAHVLLYFPTLASIMGFTKWLKKYMKNVQLSTQRFNYSLERLLEQVKQRAGIMIPAHIFTPFKGVLGSVTDRLDRLFPSGSIAAVELGLSSDSTFADRISELHAYPFLTNSDAHSLPNIGREYNEFRMKEASFEEWKKVLLRVDGRKIIANYGLHPKLGKYYRSRCSNCDQLWPAGQSIKQCPRCGSLKRIKGVRDRIDELSSNPLSLPPCRPPYIYQIPLPMFPKLGKKTLQKLYERIGPEMVVLHRAKVEEIATVAGEQVAKNIQRSREQRLKLIEGGGGRYGRIKND